LRGADLALTAADLVRADATGTSTWPTPSTTTTVAGGSSAGFTDTLLVGKGHGVADASTFFANNFLSNDNIQFSLVKYLTQISFKL
jgi:hypothetical protein